MMTAKEFQRWALTSIRVLDGATGTCLMNSGMPRNMCMAAWCLEHPNALLALQEGYVQAGSDMLYAPTLRAQPLPLSQHSMDGQTEKINERLVGLTRQAAQGCLVAGTLTTLKGWIDTSDPASVPEMTHQYRRQIHGLAAGGADVLVAETLLSSLEAIAVLEAADRENAGALICSFALRADGRLRSGEEALPVMAELLQRGAAMAGVNCVPADENLSALMRSLSALKQPLLCKPNAGRPVIHGNQHRTYLIDDATFASVLLSSLPLGARLIGGCCGTTPDTITLIRHRLSMMDS